MSKLLEGRRALVTGGSRGIGAGIVRRLAADGANVAFTYVSAGQAADELVAEIEATGGHAVGLRADAADHLAVIAAVDNAAESLGGLDILVNNAGITKTGLLEDATFEDFDALVAVNVRAVFAAIKAAARHLGQGGRIITTGSVSGDGVSGAGGALYAMSKAAVAGLTRGLARELGPRGITINTIQPGPVATEMVPENGPMSDMLRAMTAVGRFAQPAEIGSLVSYLASANSGFITGATLTIDGGMSI